MNKIIIEQFINSVWEMINKALTAVPFAVIVTGILWICVKVYKHIMGISFKNKKVIAVFLFYMACMLHMVILSRPIGSISQIDLIPFNTPGGIRYIVLYASGNALIFIPLGILLPIIFEKMRNVARSILAGFLISFFIETCQLILCCGIVQTEDVIMNTLGTAIGYIIYNKRVK